MKQSRRQFVKKAAWATSATFVASSAFSNIIVPRQKQQIGVALVGLGYYSSDLLAPALQLTKNCKLAGVVSGNPKKLEDWAAKYQLPDSNLYSYDNMDEVADNDSIDVIYIVLPTGLHAEYAIRAAGSGKHVWCEKPMARTVAECQQIIDACNKNKVKLSIGYRMHHEPNTQTLMKWAKTKPYGEILEVEAEAGYVDNRTNHWKQKKSMGGGAMYDMGVYALNAARYTTNEEPIAVTARQSTDRPEIYTEVDDTTHFELEFPSGAQANCVTSFAMNMNRLKVTAEEGWYGLEPFQAYSGIKGTTSDGKLLNLPLTSQQATQMDDDAAAIINGTPVMVPGEEGLKDIRVVEAVYQSAATGARVVI
jgi:glucose-fructose oxidoreductase